MALSDARILDWMGVGDIVIDPFDAENLATSSYDVRLGQYYYVEQRPSLVRRLMRTWSPIIYNPYDKKHIVSAWGTVRTARRARDLMDFAWGYGIRPEDRVILVRPGDTILAHTVEYIGGRNHITTMMKARSSTGRNWIEVCKCAGWGDVGYTNRWTLEITNNSRWRTLVLVVGRRIAQIVFFETGDIRALDYAAEGKYQLTGDLGELKTSWRPWMMLPRLDKDRDIKRAPMRVPDLEGSDLDLAT